MKMGLPCCTAFTERTEKLAPVRVRSTWYKTGTFGSPAGGTRDTVSPSEPHRPCHHNGWTGTSATRSPFLFCLAATEAG